MKKRYHTIQKNFLFSLTNAASGRAINQKTRLTSRGFSQNLASEAHAEGKLAKSPISKLTSVKSEQATEVELKLDDELTTAELNDFAFSCLESLANLAQKKQANFSDAIQDELTKVVNQKLNSFAKLADEAKSAKIEFKEYAAWSREFITSVQPMLNPLSEANPEFGKLTDLTAQVVECAERVMCQKYRAAALSRRVDFLVEAVASYVGEIGSAMGLPKPLLDKVERSVRGVLSDLSK